VRWLFFCAAALAVACTSSAASDPPCVEGLTTSCKPQYDPPTFATIHANILQPTCATGQGTCHTADAAKAGLVLSDLDQSYAMLVDGRRVIKGDPSCSLLMKRLTSTDPGYRMPRGPTPLNAGELCTITQWIAGGAAR